MSQINVNNIRAKDGVGPVGFPGGINATGVVTATSFSGNLTGNVTGNVTGTADLASGLTGTPNITVGTVTGTDATFSGNLTVQGTTTTIDTAVTDVDSLVVDGTVGIGTTQPTQAKMVAATAGGASIAAVKDNTGGSISFGGHTQPRALLEAGASSNDFKLYLATGSTYGAAGYSTKLTVGDGGNFIFNNAILSEKVFINTTARSGTQAVHLDDGVAHYFTTASTGTWKPNFVYSGASGAAGTFNSKVNVNSATAVTMIVRKGNTTHYADTVQVDGVDITPEWLNGAPTDGEGSGGYDIYSYTIIKTADATFNVFGSVGKYT